MNFDKASKSEVFWIFLKRGGVGRGGGGGGGGGGREGEKEDVLNRKENNLS